MPRRFCKRDTALAFFSSLATISARHEQGRGRQGMIDRILDFGADHAPVFAALLSSTVVTTASAVAWAYGRYHERATRRRRGGRLIG